LIALLQTPLNQSSAALSNGFRQDIDCLGNISVDALQWLQRQSELPRFYWQSRDGDLEIAAAGAARIFCSLEEAQQFVRHCAPSDFQPLLVGGIPFPGIAEAGPDNKSGTAKHDPGQCSTEMFFLPRRALIRRGSNSFLVSFLRLRNQSGKELAQTLSSLGDAADNQHCALPQLHSRVDQPDQNQWCDLVQQVLQPEALVSTPKVVLARRSRYAVQGQLNEFALLKKWQQSEPHTMPFLLQSNAGSCFLGCTPERLYRRRGRDIITEALAGTIQKTADGKSDEVSAAALRSDVKIRRENYLVQDYIERRLLPLCEGVKVRPVADVVELKYIQHLRKNIAGCLRTGILDSTILQSLHPTPAVGGSPCGDALKFIATHEHFQRGWYAGAIGYLSADEAEFSVAIRSAQVKGRSIDFYAGAGIVAGSEASSEWQELDNKIESVLNLFEIADSPTSV